MSNSINERVERLRGYLRGKGLLAFIFPSTDPHQGEYVPAHWQTRQWISGFDGSAGTAVVTISDAALWTDSRYFIAAEKQLEGTPFRLMKDGLPDTPTIPKWLIESIQNSQFIIHNESGEAMGNEQTVGIDGSLYTPEDIEVLRAELGKAGIGLRTDLDPAEELWTDRPPIPKNKVEIQPLEFAGETAQSKIERVRQALRERCAESIVISALDDIAWLLNLRGSDVHCNPVFVSYVLLTLHDVTLFIDSDKLDETVKDYLKETGVKVRPYEEAKVFSEGQGARSKEQENTIAHSNPLAPCPLPLAPIKESLISSLKCVKNAAEIEGYRRAMVRDGVAMVKFLHWLKPAVEAGGETEISIDRKLTALRAEQALYRGLSFDTIAGYGPHGAIVHYEATPETDIPIEPHGLLLLDSGAQYQDGTTDITRTIALGPLTDEERFDYTLVLKCHISLALTRFPDGISGTRLDAMARYPMWRYGINYGHGTGHGVGSYLCVHEGPHQIRHTWKPAPLHAGMTVTDEPGIYREGRHGVRIENTMLIVEDGETEFGKFLRLEPLTLCPIDLTPVLWDMMTPEEINYLNAYHKKVYEELAPYLTEEERKSLPQPLQRRGEQ